MSSLPDIEARRRALDPTASFIVQAPAGSGKTELLTQRYLRLLATVESPEQVLAITFTRKAAAEMRARVLHALSEAAGPPPEPDHKRSSWELAHAVRDADARHHWRLAKHPARLRIQTIDALNASLARRLPVLAGTGSALEPTDDPAVLYEMATRKLLERLGDGSSVARQLEIVITHLANRVDRLANLMCDLLAKRDQWLHPVIRARASAELRATLEGTLSRVVRRHLAELCEALGEDRRLALFELLRFSAGNLLAGDTLSPARREQLELCIAREAPPDEDDASLDTWRALVTLLFKQDGELYSIVNTRHGFPTTHREWKSRMLDMLKWLKTDESLCERLIELRVLPNGVYTDEQWATLQALLELLPAAVAELQLVFQSQGTADYVEIALRALRALGTADEPTDLALAFDYRLQHILVDEFQDTSFAQLDLLERLTAGWTEGDGRTLFCVGDPMQSIYRFRQAEVGLFIEMQERGLRNLRLEPLRLEANFRSTRVLVDWVNTMFPAVLASRNDAEQGAVRYSPSVAARSDAGGAVSVHAFVNGDEEQEAARIESIVKDALEQDGGRVAILVTARTHVDAIARRLTTSGIEFRAVEIEQLRERPVVQDLIALTRALVHVADRTAWLAVLRAPWCGLTLPDLHAVAAQSKGVITDGIEKALTVAPRDLFDPDALSADGRDRLTRAYAVLRDAQGERGRWPLRIWVERTWNALGGPATLARTEDLDDAEAYFDRLEQIETAGDLEDVARLEQQLQRLFASGRMHGDPRVEIMTIHAAKGLEFDTVILPGLQRHMRSEDRELLRWTRIAGAEGGMVFAPIKAEGSDSDAIYRWIGMLERQRILRERARLLYVAVTRAKRELHLLGNAAASTRDGNTTPREPRRESMLHMLWSAVASEFESAAAGAPAASAPKPVAVQRLRRLPPHWSAPSAPSTLELATMSVVDVTSERPLFDWVTETSRHVGTLVHRELDRLSRRRSPADPPPDLREARARILIELAELGVPPERCEAAYDRVIAAIEHTLIDERGRWLLGLDGTVSDAASEFALSGVVDGQIVQGVIDRTFTDAEGVRWVVDFKTSTHEGAGLSTFVDEEVTRYRGQLARYAQLLRMYKPERVRAALYFPLLRVWREVEV